MILKSYYDLASAVAEGVPTITWRDLDKGQLDNPDAFNTVLLPGLLVGFSEIEWETFGQKSRLGWGTLTLKLVVWLPAQTHDTDPLFATNLDALSLVDDLQQTVLAVPFVRSFIRSHDYDLADRHVTELTYQVCLVPDPPHYRWVSVKPQFTPQLITHLP